MEPVVRVGVWAGEQVNCSKFHTIEWFLSAFEINDGFCYGAAVEEEEVHPKTAEIVRVCQSV